ncbi:hypothetical protein [Wenzhouxiangella sp. XN24]|uniref:hypothetical protein n=1 Tax=Wenzhouxiangella sp. XN24 TaxID=2713569 RepID=UPI0013EC6918|nr:hypothetical protein [Wenzhouxiangella sp. XN24]NGX15991.1 hypothetical protein [Wenzhouxiangella sp. XN24]
MLLHELDVSPDLPLTSGTALFLERAQLDRLVETTLSIGRVLAEFSGATPEVHAAGLFNSFDYHLAADGPRLIEINTNAGGAFLQQAILEDARGVVTRLCGSIERREVAPPASMMLATWAALRPGRMLSSVAVVDEAPELQPLYRDMQGAVDALRAMGIDARVSDIQSLRIEGARLVDGQGPIDFVYNRATDFLLADPCSTTLREAWQAGLAVVAPNPDVYRAYADKRLLLRLAAERCNSRPGLEAVLPTVEVTAGAAPELWRERKSLVFKPFNGFASRGVVLGAKISRRRFDSLVDAGFIAQSYVPPITRMAGQGEATTRFKADIRVWTHGFTPWYAAARRYRGQVSGMRQPGEGFAPIIWLAPGSQGVSCSA